MIRITKDILYESPQCVSKSYPSCNSCTETFAFGEVPKEDFASIKEARILCFDCDQYICQDCVSKHRCHSLMNKDDDEYIKNDLVVKFISDLRGKEDDLWNNIRVERFEIQNKINIVQTKDAGIDAFDGRLCPLKDGSIIALADCWNNSVKLYETDGTKIIRAIYFSSKPFGITDVSTDIYNNPSTFAITFPLEKLVCFMDISEKPSLITEQLNMRKDCFKIEYCKGKFVTYCNERDLLIIFTQDGATTLELNLKKMLGNNSDDIHSFAVNKVDETIYISEMVSKSLFCITIGGQVLRRFKFSKFDPYRLCINSGRGVYIYSGSSQNEIYKLSEKLDETVKLIIENKTSLMRKEFRTIASGGLFLFVAFHDSIVTIKCE